jgi:Zn-dependent protease/CBS domain-containing protein
MLGTRWRLFRLMGVPVSVDPSWLIVLALLTLSLAGLFPDLVETYYPGAATIYPVWVYWLVALGAALAFFGCILLHELGHAVVARADRMPIRGITLFLFGGVAEIGDEPPSAAAELRMAVAGPAVSVLLAILLGLLAWFGYRAAWPPLAVIGVGYLAAINALVLLFNLIPAFPLDGGRVLRSILWQATGSLRRATYWAAWAGRGFAWLLIGWGVLNFFAGNWLGGIWIGLVGLFLSNAARASYQQVLVREILEGEPVRRFMNPDPITIKPTLDLRQWAEDFVYVYHRKAFPVVSDGRLLGLIETRALAKLPRGQWHRHTVGDMMRQDLRGITIAPDADALKALRKMQLSGSSRLLVTEGNRLVGILSLKDLLTFLSLKIELEGTDEDRREQPTAPVLGDEQDARAVAGRY